MIDPSTLSTAELAERLLTCRVTATSQAAWATVEVVGAELIAEAARRLTATCAEKPPQSNVTTGWWPVNCVQRAFVDGAAWWQWKQKGYTPWSHERDEFENEAIRRYGEPQPDQPTDRSDDHA